MALLAKLRFSPFSLSLITLIGCAAYADELTHEYETETTRYSHRFAYEFSQYEENYQLDDLSVQYKPQANNLSYEWMFDYTWSVYLSRYDSSSDVNQNLPIPTSTASFASLESQHNYRSNSISFSRYWPNYWVQLGYSESIDERNLDLRSPNRVILLEEEHQYTTYSLGLGGSYYLGDSIFDASFVLDSQHRDSDDQYLEGTGIVDNRSIFTQRTQERSDGLIGTLSLNAGYGYYFENTSFHPNLNWSHTRTLDGNVDQFQRSNQRFVTTNRVVQSASENSDKQSSEASPVSVWSLSGSFFWGNAWLQLSRQHYAGRPTNEDVYALGLGWRFDH